MAFKMSTQKSSGKISEVTIGTGDKAIKLGGQNVLPFYSFDGDTGNIQKVGVEINDIYPESWIDCYKEMCELDSMYFYGNPKSGGAFIWMIPKQVFDSFKETFVLTYMFDYQLQKYYYDYNNIKYDKYYLLDDKLIYGSLDYNGNKYKNLITVCDNHKMNKIGDDYYSLAMGWYKRNKTTVLINELRKNICNYFVNITKTKSKNNLWTTFKEYKTSLKGNGYSKGFAWLNIRAVNEYSNKIAIAYVVNRFMNPIIKNFFEQNGR